MTFYPAKLQKANILKCQHLQDNSILVNGSRIFFDKIGTILLLFYVN